MSERAGRTFICSVLFLDIVAYSRKPVSEQIRLKDHFNALIASALRDVAPADRIILDTGDGVAINFLGDPNDEKARQNIAELRITKPGLAMRKNAL